MRNIYLYETSIGCVAISDNGEAITGLTFASEKWAIGMNTDSSTAVEMDSHQMKSGNYPNDPVHKETSLINEAAKQLMEYLAGRRTVFDIPVVMKGTPFQKTVWKALTEIPYGEIRSYSEVAESIGRPRACRAVGMANNRNPVAIIVPCHRVIGANGKLVGYAGGLEIKQRLLELERRKGSRRYE